MFYLCWSCSFVKDDVRKAVYMLYIVSGGVIFEHKIRRIRPKYNATLKRTYFDSEELPNRTTWGLGYY